MRNGTRVASRCVFVAILLAATIIAASCSGVGSDLRPVFGDRLGRVRENPDYVAIEVSGEITEGELFQALDVVAAESAATERVEVWVVLPDDAGRIESLVWDREEERLERWTGDGGDGEFVDNDAGVSTLFPVGVVTSDVDADMIEVYATGEAVPSWSRPETSE